MAAVEDGSVDGLGEGEERETASLLNFVSAATSDIQQKLSKPIKPKRKVNIRKYIQRNVHSPCGALRRSREGRSEPYPCQGKPSRRETASAQAENETLDALFESVQKPGGQLEAEAKGTVPMRSRNLPASFFRQPGAVGAAKDDVIRGSAAQQALLSQAQALCGSMEALNGMDMELMGRYMIPEMFCDSFDMVRVEARTPQTAYDGSPGRLGSPLACSDSSEPILSSSPDSGSLPSYSPCGQRSASTPMNEEFNIAGLEEHLIGYPLPALSPSCLQDIAPTALPPNNPQFSNQRRDLFDGMQQSAGLTSASGAQSVPRSISGGVERPASHPTPQLNHLHPGTDPVSLRSTQPVTQCGPFHNPQQQRCPSAVTNPGGHQSSRRLSHLNGFTANRSSPSQHCQQYPATTLQTSHSLSSVSVTAGASQPASLPLSNAGVQRSSSLERCGQYPAFPSLHNLYLASMEPTQSFVAPPSSQIMTADAASFSSTLPVLAHNPITPVPSRLAPMAGTQAGLSCSTPNSNCYPGLPGGQGCMAGVGGQGGAYGGLITYHATSLSPSGLPAFPKAFPTPTPREQQSEVEVEEAWLPCDGWTLDDLC